MTPVETLTMAQRMLERPEARTAGIWPRAAALLGRQALEQGLDEFWRGRGIALHNLGTRPQLICLSAYLPDRDVAARASHAWSSLTRACHHHPYELPPGHAELRSSLDAVAETLAATAAEQRAR